MVRQIAVGVAWVCLLPVLAQEQPNLFKSAPPEVEKALRERVDAYFTMQKEGRFRQADALIAEDSKDVYFEQQKQKIRGHEIARINWNDDFKQAVVVVAVKMDIVYRGEVHPVDAPLAYRWRLENGQWVLYFDTQAGKESPFGRMKAGANAGTGGVDPEQLIKNPSLIFNQIKVEKQEITLRSHEKSTDTVRIANGLQGGISLSFVPDLVIPGFSFRIEKPQLNAGEETKLIFTFDPGKDRSAKPTVTGHLRVDPFNKDYPMKIVFALPEAVQKQLPQK